MRGQMIFEFVVAALLFFIILFYIIGFLSASFETRTADVGADSLVARLTQLSASIVSDGAVNDSFIDGVCNRGIIDGRANFNINTSWQNGTIIRSCGRPAVVSGIRRVGLLGGEPVVVSLAIW